MAATVIDEQMALSVSTDLVQAFVILVFIDALCTGIVYGDYADMEGHNTTQHVDASVLKGPFNFHHIADADNPGQRLLEGIAMTAVMFLGVALMGVLFLVVVPRCKKCQGKGSSPYGPLYNENITSTVNSVSVKTV
ncbi:uncharacterized protein [Haliotis cracherodii]|uniref:uncharacterized protein isoform X1 n=2 Tax=Haliotis cracherodii TaxID=6455 RepID=UPI0039E78A3E